MIKIDKNIFNGFAYLKTQEVSLRIGLQSAISLNAQKENVPAI